MEKWEHVLQKANIDRKEYFLELYYLLIKKQQRAVCHNIRYNKHRPKDERFDEALEMALGFIHFNILNPIYYRQEKINEIFDGEFIPYTNEFGFTTYSYFDNNINKFDNKEIEKLI